MSLKTKVKSYSFWVSLASALILILKLVGQRFGFSVDEGLISDLFTSFCAILVLLGIIVVPSTLNIEQKVVDSVDKKESSVNETKTLENANQKQETIEIVEKNKDIVENLEAKAIVETNKQEVVEEKFVEQDNQNSAEIMVENVVADIVTKHFDIQSFIDKVCTKRAELDNNISNFVEFLQGEIDIIKNDNK